MIVVATTTTTATAWAVLVTLHKSVSFICRKRLGMDLSAYFIANIHADTDVGPCFLWHQFGSLRNVLAVVWPNAPSVTLWFASTNLPATSGGNMPPM